MSLWLIHHPISSWLLTLIPNTGRPGCIETWVGDWKRRAGWKVDITVDSLGQPEVSWGQLVQRHLWSCVLVGSYLHPALGCCWIWLRCLQPPLMGSPVTRPTTFFSQVCLPYRDPWSILIQVWSSLTCFINHSLPCLQGKIQIPQHGWESLSRSYFSTCFLPLAHVHSHSSYTQPLVLPYT